MLLNVEASTSQHPAIIATDAKKNNPTILWFPPTVNPGLTPLRPDTDSHLAALDNCSKFHLKNMEG